VTVDLSEPEIRALLGENCPQCGAPSRRHFKGCTRDENEVQTARTKLKAALDPGQEAEPASSGRGARKSRFTTSLPVGKARKRRGTYD
jgi:hypothetical protein